MCTQRDESNARLKENSLYSGRTGKLFTHLYFFITEVSLCITCMRVLFLVIQQYCQQLVSVVSDGRMTDEWWTGENLEGNSCGLTEVLSWRVWGKSCKTCQDSECWLRFELIASRRERAIARPTCSVYIPECLLVNFPCKWIVTVEKVDEKEEKSIYSVSVLIRRHAVGVTVSRPVHGGLGDYQQHTWVCGAVYAASPWSAAPCAGRTGQRCGAQ
jgi:hypothetical protein